MSGKHPFLSVSEDLRTSYLVVLAATTSADQESSSEEIAFMEQMAIAANLSEENRKIVKKATEDINSTNLSGHLEDFKDNDLRFSLMADMLNVCYADGNLNQDEIKQLDQINQVLGINEEQFKALQQYVTTANKEAEKVEGNPELKKAPQKANANTEAEGKEPKEEKSFLEKTGLGNMLQGMGIPVDNFQNGSTVGTALTSTAFTLLQTYVTANTKAGQENSLGDTIGGFIGNLLDGNKKEGEKEQSGVTTMIAGFFKSDAGSATINSVLQNVTDSVAKGKGIGNLGEILGGKNQQNLIGGVLGALMQSGQKK